MTYIYIYKYIYNKKSPYTVTKKYQMTWLKTKNKHHIPARPKGIFCAMHRSVPRSPLLLTCEHVMDRFRYRSIPYAGGPYLTGRPVQEDDDGWTKVARDGDRNDGSWFVRAHVCCGPITYVVRRGRSASLVTTTHHHHASN